MLEDKEYVINNSDEGENNLCNIEPILYRKTSTCERKNSSYKIKQNIKYWPTFRAFSFIVPISGRSVFN